MTAPLPLFDLPRMRALAELEEKRATLMARMEDLPPNSHKRVILQDRLQSLTAEALRLSPKPGEQA